MKDLSVDKNVLTYLQEFGLNDKEIVIYLSLLKYGPNTIMDLARKTGIKRSTTHNNVEELIKKGLVSQTNYGERRMVIAEDPDKLKFLLEQRKWEVSKLERNMDGIVEEIYNSIPKAKENTNVEVKYYKGDKEVSYVYDLSLKANEVHSFADLEKYYDVFPDNLKIWKNALERNPKRHVWDLIVESGMSRKIAAAAHPRYHFKILKKQSFFEGFDFADYLIFNNKVCIIQLKRGESVATVIDSTEMAKTLIALHKTMWSLI